MCKGLNAIVCREFRTRFVDSAPDTLLQFHTEVACIPHPILRLCSRDRWRSAPAQRPFHSSFSDSTPELMCSSAPVRRVFHPDSVTLLQTRCAFAQLSCVLHFVFLRHVREGIVESCSGLAGWAQANSEISPQQHAVEPRQNFNGLRRKTVAVAQNSAC
jgi:hypothetical protein